MLIELAICVMAKAPVPGRVKTRLVPPLSSQQAATLAAAFLEDTWRAACGVEGALLVLAHAGDSANWPAVVDSAERIAQPEGDLGARIEAVAAAALSRASRVLLVGSDLPGLPAEYLRLACDQLARADAVIGPSADGGFYLIGLRAPIPGVLSGVPWSAPDTREQTIDALRGAGRSVALCPSFDDVDDPTDLERLRRELSAGTVTAEATRRALATFR